MTPNQKNVAEQASKEMDSKRLMILVTELCDAIDVEHIENRQSRRGCLDDCREYSKFSSAIRRLPAA
jgi:hypothetical protein